MSAKVRESTPKTGYLGIMSRRKIRAKIAELERSGELQRWIEKAGAEVKKAAAEAPPETAEPETEEIGFG